MSAVRETVAYLSDVPRAKHGPGIAFFETAAIEYIYTDCSGFSSIRAAIIPIYTVRRTYGIQKAVQKAPPKMGYEQEAEGANGRTAFRRAEKQYRLNREGDSSRRSRKGRKKPLQAEVDLSDVVDFDRVAAEGSDSSYAREQGVQKVEGEVGLPTYALCSHPGM